MEEDFTVHLVSNVSPGTFPNNNPASFSTLLANDIDLNEGKWEVAVRQMMYPTHVATTNKKDDNISIYEYEENYRNLLPCPKINSFDLKNVGALLNFNHIRKAKGQPTKEITMAMAKTEAMITAILNTVNTSEWATKGILEMSFNRKHYKFILYLRASDIIVLFNEELRKILGFVEQAYSYGTYWAETSFKHLSDKISTSKDMTMSLFDLQVLETEEHHLLMSYDSTRDRRYYEKVIPNKLRDTIPVDYYGEPKFAFVVDPNDGGIKQRLVMPLPIVHKKHEDQLVFYRFDKNSTEKFNFKHIYYAGQKERHWFPIPTKEMLNNVPSVAVHFYFASVREITRAIKETPYASFPIESGREIEKPQDFLLLLNGKKELYKYKFSFDENSKRYALQVGKPYALEISKNLSSILGFSTENCLYHKNTHTVANDVPILHRAITALYVYTNIIDSVYIGDVRAPLLLTCPFKRKERKDLVHQVEFLNPTYVRLNRNTIQQINIDIYDDAGTLIPFLYGKTKLTLHFRKRAT